MLGEQTQSPQVVRRPLLMAATMFCFGVLASRLGDLTSNLLLTLGIAAFCYFLAHRRRILAIFLLPIGFLGAGMVVGSLQRPPEQTLTTQSSNYAEQPLLLEGIVREAPELRPEGQRLLVDLIATSTSPVGGSWLSVQGRALITVGRWQDEPCGGPGDRIRVFAKVRDYAEKTFPGGISARALAARRGAALKAFAPNENYCLLLQNAEKHSFLGFMESVRNRMHLSLAAVLPAEQASIVRAFTTGDTSGISAEVQDSFRDSGLSHLLAVSGLNLALVSWVFMVGLYWLLRRSSWASLGFGARRWAALAAVPVVVLYTYLVGASPSAVRACWMVLALIAAQIFMRLSEAWSALALTVLIMVALDPGTLGDVSFQLSFAAVAALLRVYPALQNWWFPKLSAKPWIVRISVEVSLATLAATIGTAPLVARHFGRISLVGLLANLPAAPLGSVVLVPFSLLGGLTSLVSPQLAKVFLIPAGYCADLLLKLAQWSASLPLATLDFPKPTILEACLFYGAMIGLSLGAQRKKMRAFGLVCLLGIVLSVSLHSLNRYTRDSLRVTYLPVGQGDGMAVEFPGGEVMVIDAGPSSQYSDAGERVLIPYLRRRRIQTIDYLVLSHPHADHIGGVEALSEAITIKQVFYSGDRREAPKEMLAAIDRLSPQVVNYQTAPQEIGGVQLKWLGPLRAPGNYHDVNDGSVVLKLTLGAHSFLFTGDVELEAEQELTNKYGSELKATVLKAGHHGSRSSSHSFFLEKVQPEHMVMQLGKNNVFRFPHRQALKRMEHSGAKLWRTDIHGAITIETDGEALSVEPYLKSQ